jgi:hypothetical protein
MPLYAAGQKIRGSEINALPQLYRVAADQSNNTASFVDVAGLAFTGEINAVYLVECFLVYLSPAARDIKFQWSIPLGTVGWWGADGIETGGTTVGQVNRQTLAIQTPGVHAFAGDTLESNAKPVAWVFIGGTPGTVKLQFAQLSAGAGPTTIRSPSCIRVGRLS